MELIFIVFWFGVIWFTLMSILDVLKDIRQLSKDDKTHAEWKIIDTKRGYLQATCTKCKFSDLFTTKEELLEYEYCPNCGEKMEMPVKK